MVGFPGTCVGTSFLVLVSDIYIPYKDLPSKINFYYVISVLTFSSSKERRNLEIKKRNKNSVPRAV